ncbi:MAG: tetratricopeptide repeat protein [bacterium]
MPEVKGIKRAKALLQEGHVEEAEALLESIASSARYASEYRTEAEAFRELGMAQLNGARPHPAVSSLQYAWRAAESVADPAIQSDIMYWLARAHLAANDPRTAETFLLRCVVAREETPDLRPLLGMSYLYLAFAAAGCDNLRVSIAANQKGLAWSTERGEKALAAGFAFNLGVDFFDIRDFKSAASWFLDARKAYQALKRPRDAALVLYLAGRSHFESGDSEQARDAFSQALMESHTQGDRENMGYCSAALAQVSMQKGDIWTAVGQFDEARIAFRDLDDLERSFTCYNWAEAARAFWKSRR